VGSGSPDSGEFLYSPQCAAQGESEALLEEVQALRLEIAELRQNIEDLTTIVQAFVEMFVSPASGV
jgi:t-SNARE complex subunit (syntaxin)